MDQVTPEHQSNTHPPNPPKSPIQPQPEHQEKRPGQAPPLQPPVKQVTKNQQNSPIQPEPANKEKNVVNSLAVWFQRNIFPQAVQKDYEW